MPLQFSTASVKENPAHKSQIYIWAAIYVAVKIAKCVKKKNLDVN